MPTPLNIVAEAVSRILNTIIGPITIVVMRPLRGDTRAITLRFTRTGNSGLTRKNHAEAEATRHTRFRRA